MGQASWQAKARLDNVQGLLQLYRPKKPGSHQGEGPPVTALPSWSPPPWLFPPLPAPHQPVFPPRTSPHQGFLKEVPWGLGRGWRSRQSTTPGGWDLIVGTGLHPQLRPAGTAPPLEPKGWREGEPHPAPGKQWGQEKGQTEG